MYDGCVTLYNRHGGAWYPTPLTSVNLALTSAAGAGSAARGDVIKLGVRCRRTRDGAVYVAGKRWLPPARWRAEDDEAVLSSSLTFATGEDFDFVVIGGGETSVVNDGDYDAASGGFYGYKNALGGAFALTSAEGPYTVIPHFELTAE